MRGRRVFAGVLGLVLTVFSTGCASRFMKATPLYTGEAGVFVGPPEDRINLWPLFYHRKPATSLLWPLMDKTDDHVAARPIVSVYKLDKDRHEYNLAGGLIQFDMDDDDHRVFPLFWGNFRERRTRSDDNSYIAVFPEFWWINDEVRALLPFAWIELDDDALWYDWPLKSDAFLILPLGWFIDDDVNALFPLWIYLDKSRGYDFHALWPVFRYKRKDDGKDKGFRVWPLIGMYRDDEDRYYWALWPLVHEWLKPDEATRIAFPVFFQHKESDEDWTLALPLAFHYKDNNKSLLLTPLWSRGEKGESTWSTLFPLYYSSRDPERNVHRLLTPLAGRTKSPKGTRWFVFPALSSVAWGEGEKDVWFAAPLIHARWGSDDVQHHVLPFYFYDKGHDAFVTPLAGWWKHNADRFFSVLTLLAFYKKEADGGNDLWLLPPLSRCSWQEGEGVRETHLVPLFNYDKRPGGYNLWIAPWMTWRRWSKGFDSRFFPIWNYREREGTNVWESQKDFSFLMWLYDYRHQEGYKGDKEDMPDDYIRSRLLVRMMHYERADGDAALDLFPFITHDTKADGYRQTSFMWRFFRYERKADGGRNLDLLFLPVLRGKIK